MGPMQTSMSAILPEPQTWFAIARLGTTISCASLQGSVYYLPPAKRIKTSPLLLPALHHREGRLQTSASEQIKYNCGRPINPHTQYASLFDQGAPWPAAGHFMPCTCAFPVRVCRAAAAAEHGPRAGERRARDKH